jgi:hypothetical protein
VKKFGLILLVLTLSRVAVAYAATPPADTSSASSLSATNNNYFFGGGAAGTAALNQVLALLVGPKGDVGPAGVAGKNGLNGLNGVNGLPGAPGEVGATGPQGPAGKNGINGLNGVNGAQGPAGPAGPAGANGTGGGGGGNLTYGAGQIAIGTCQPTADTVTVSIDRSFDGNEFRFFGFNFTNISTSCGGKVLNVDIKMASSVSSGKSYSPGDELICKYNLPSTPAATTHVTDLTATTCTNITQNVPLRIDAVNTLDFTGNIGFEIADT